MPLRTLSCFFCALAALTVTAAAHATPQAAEEPSTTIEAPSTPACEPGTTRAAPEEVPPMQPAPAPTAYGEPAPAPAEPTPAPEARRRRENRIFAPQSIAFVTGAGVSDYFGNSLTVSGGQGLVDPGAAWDARFVFGTRSIIALEAGYIGAVNRVDVAGKNGNINSNGIDGTLRLQLPYRVQPYAFAGVGWNHMTLDNGDANPQVTQRFREDDDQVTIPAGAGISGYLGRHATVDVRGTYRLIPDNDITVMSDQALHQWIAQARVGYVF